MKSHDHFVIGLHEVHETFEEAYVSCARGLSDMNRHERRPKTNVKTNHLMELHAIHAWSPRAALVDVHGCARTELFKMNQQDRSPKTGKGPKNIFS